MTSAPPVCGSCTRRETGPGSERWIALKAALDLGHDVLAHSIYLKVLRSGLTVEELKAMTDEELRTWHAVGDKTIARLRTAIPRPRSLKLPGEVGHTLHRGAESASTAAEDRLSGPEPARCAP